MALYVVATPIGNLEDITGRALRILREVQAVIAEDTRTYRKLATRYGIPAKPLYSLYKGNESARARQILPKLQEGLEAALVSESGTPGVSDPGALLVRQCLEAGVRVVPIPGPSSITAVLSAAGIFAWPVVLFGFLSGKQTLDHVLQAVTAGQTAVFFEHPARLPKTLNLLSEKAPSLRAVIGRELTKHFEQIWAGPVSDAGKAFDARNLKGELVIALEPRPGEARRAAVSEENIDRARSALQELRDARMTLSSAVRKVGAEAGVPRKRLYDEALKIWPTTR
ncbi:16S rRNA (cytidine(1402)-2'-O)-methyltransferase [bacterium]|nr:16S rRNA (cytidine(1402)-2'-O)-methyltransferase [bacterium]